MVKDVVVVALILAAVAGNMFYVSSRLDRIADTTALLGASSGRDQFSDMQLYGNTTAGCLKGYQINATTLASSTMYLMVSTSIGSTGAATKVFDVIATTTKPAICN